MTQRPFIQRNVPRAEAQAILTIDLGAIAQNWRALDAASGQAECGAVVKADAYGCGIEAVSPALEAAGCRTFFISHLSEGRRVRACLHNKDARIFLLNGLMRDVDAAGTILDNRIIPVIGSREEWRFWRDHAPADAKAALHINTGMNRLGMPPQDARAIASESGAQAAIELVMSHFVSSEVADDPLNARQIAAFMAALETFPGKPASVANSSGVFLASKPHLDLVRPGYALYGGNPTPGRPNPMRSVVTLEAPILQVREISVGETVGYNAQWSAPRPSRLATIGLGYADGLPRSAVWTKDKRGGEAIVGGVRCPFAGRISMDLTVLDVTDVPDGAAIPGAPARLLGPEIGVDELGARAGTIGYEILTSLGQRYHRVYVGG